LMWIPEIVAYLGRDLLTAAALASCLAYLAFCVVWAARGRFFENRDSVVILFGAALVSYFLPTFVLAGKPYALLIWAGAHGLQYYLMVWSSLSMSERSAAASNTVAAGLIVAAILALLTYVSYSTTLATSGDFWASTTTRVIFGIVVSVNLIHF